MAAPSGPGTHIREVIKGFEERGHTVVKFIAGGERLADAGSAINYKTHSWKKLIPSFLWHTLKDHDLLRKDKKQYHQLLDLIDREKPDFIYERAYYLMHSGYKAAIATRTPYYCEINAPYPEEKSSMDGTSIYLSKAVQNEKDQVRAAHKVFVVSSALKQYLAERIPGQEEKIIVTPNAVNPAHMQSREENVLALRTKFNITSDNHVTGFVGSIFPYHGVDVLIEAFAGVREKKTGQKLLIVGDGAILNELRNRVTQFGMEQDVIFTGNVSPDQVADHIALMHIAVMAKSNWYGSPVKIFEYGAMGKAIIAPDVVPVHDVMIDEQDGLIISDNADTMKNALLRMIENPEAAAKMAATFHHKVMTKHTWQQVSDTILEAAL